jgi:hypothetical protein
LAHSLFFILYSFFFILPLESFTTAVAFSLFFSLRYWVVVIYFSATLAVAQSPTFFLLGFSLFLRRRCRCFFCGCLLVLSFLLLFLLPHLHRIRGIFSSVYSSVFCPCRELLSFLRVFVWSSPYCRNAHWTTTLQENKGMIEIGFD